MTAPPGEVEGGLMAPTAEFALFIGGAILTLVVIVFVTVLMVSIFREEKAAAQDRESRRDDPHGADS